MQRLVERIAFNEKNDDLKLKGNEHWKGKVSKNAIRRAFSS